MQCRRGSLLDFAAPICTHYIGKKKVDIDGAHTIYIFSLSLIEFMLDTLQRGPFTACRLAAFVSHALWRELQII